MIIVDFLFPRSCLGCRSSGEYICSSCLGKLRPLKQICTMCERPSVDGMTHIKCRRPWGLDGMVFLWPYGGIVRKAILGLKYKYAKEIAKELAGHIVEYLQKRKVALPMKSALVPVPLYWFRENWRGFNQVEEVGNLISERVGWQFCPDILVRKESRRPQTELKRDERRKNIRGVFALNPNYKLQITNYPPGHSPEHSSFWNGVRPSRAGGQSLILFDDVWTTGSTLKEAAKVLKRAGAREVWGLTIAR